MIDIISMELKKFQKSRMLWVVLLSSIVLAGFAMSCYTARGQFGIQRNIYVGMVSINLVFGIVIISIYTSFVFTMEYSEDTINNLLTSPISRTKILVGKIIVVLIAMAATLLLVVAFILIFTGILSGEKITYGGMGIGECLSLYLWYASISVLMQFMLTPFMAFISIWRKNLLHSIIISIFIVIMNTILMNIPMRYAFFSPWNTPGIVSFSFTSYGKTWRTGIPGLASSVIMLLALFVVGMVASIAYYNKSDVNSNK